MSTDPLNLRPPRFNFRENRKRAPLVGKVSPLKTKYVLWQILDSDASDAVYISWFLNRYQKILPKRVTRLTLKEQKALTTHTKRLRHLLIFSTQNKPTTTLKFKPRKFKSGLQRKRKNSVRSIFGREKAMRNNL